MMSQQHSAKSRKMLGITPSALVKAFCAKGNAGMLKYGEWEAFWDALPESAMEQTACLRTVLTTLFAMLEDPDSCDVRLSTLVNTIQFLIVYHTPRVSKDEARGVGVAVRLAEWKDSTGKKFSQQYPQVHEVMRTLQLCEDDKRMLEHCTTQATILHTPEEFGRMGDIIHFPVFTDGDISSGEAVFYWLAMRRRLEASPGDAVQMVRRLVHASRTLVQQVKSNPKWAQTSLLAQLHMIRELLAVAPVTDGAALDEAEQMLSQFYMWPLPYALVARDLLEAVGEERVSPGATMRRKFAAEKETAMVTGRDDELGQGARPAYYFALADGGDQGRWVSTFVHTLALAPYDRARESIGNTYRGELSASTALLLACSALRASADGGLPEADAQHAAGLGPEQALQLWKEVSEALDETEAEVSDGNAAGRQQRLAAARAKLPDLAAASKSPCLPRGAGLPEPRMPPVEHIAFRSLPAFEFTDKWSQKLMGVDYVPYPTTPVSAQLETLLETYRQNPGVDVRVVLSCGNTMLHSFVCAYAQMLQNKPDGLGVNLKLYLVPFERNHVASFLARHDSFYNRHVYVPFRSPVFVMPWIDSDPRFGATALDEDEKVPEAPLSVGVMFRDLVSVYLREARSTYAMRLWKVDAWTESKEGEQHDHSIPFLQRFEMGLVPQARAYQKEKGLPSDVSFQTLVKDRNFKFQPPDVSVTFTRVNMHGHQLEPVSDESVPYNSVLLANVPRRGDASFPPSPAAGWLEMHARLSDSSQNRAKARKNALMSDPKQHVHSVTITAADPDTPFLVRVDGFNFGPYKKVVVSPLEDPKTHEQMTFPIQTFFPIEV